MNSININVTQQQLRLLDDAGNLLHQYPVSTSKYGTGCENGSEKTPLGLHRIKEKLGGAMPVNEVFYWAITANSKPASIFIPIKVLDVESRNEIHKDIKAIKEETHASDEVGLLIIAAFYESHNLYHLANDSYLEAIRLNPENQLVKEYYHLFMARMGDF